MKNPRDVEVKEPGYLYLIPNYNVENDGIKDSEYVFAVPFCRGDRLDETKPRKTGTFVESLLEVVAHRLKFVNVGDLATRETAVAITKIEEAIMWLEKRSADRRIRGVEGSYKQ